ncbi:MAG TPA: malto-oligosyltrehalose trehalohydrolase [Usitatibacter sp.]|jgi:maltooligosyltrehalose trehalohydrolase|nr:malto-oligosyltrehalose trehalohydrolase [Usitatibacter sp.]
MSRALDSLAVSSAEIVRRLPVGAELQPAGGVHFRVWAPHRKDVDVVLEGPHAVDSGPGVSRHRLQPEPGGYHSGLVTEARAGSLYRYRLDEGESFPDPASRFQPEGPHGPSQVVDPGAYAWSDGAWRGAALPGQVIYEMHAGTFTREGTWRGAMRELRELAACGITTLEVMPVADFCGRFGWGYDGVDLFAPTRLYGTPDELRAFVDHAHACGLAVVLDVVYNHLGPDGAYLHEFSPEYYTDRYENEWGEPINFDGPGSRAVREFFVANAAYWVDEFHIDGLRLDATQQIFDASPVNVMLEITRAVREAARGRDTMVIAENEPQRVGLVRPPEAGGYGMDGLWNDDFHHSATVALTGRNEAYYSDYRGTAQELLSAVKWGYLYQGQRYRWQGKRRGTPAFGVAPAAFVNCIQNHDQVANSAFGRRIHALTSPALYRAMTALMLLAPGTPMLFQGQEFASSAPFLFFADHKPELAQLVRGGRREFVRQFPSLATTEMSGRLPNPCSEETFLRCKLDFSERETHAETYAMHRDLLRLRREDAAFRAQRAGGMDGAVLNDAAFLLRFFGEEPGADRLVVVNLGRDLHDFPSPEPLLAPPEGCAWETLWTSEDPRYGGQGTPALETAEGWRVPGHATVVLRPQAEA